DTDDARVAALHVLHPVRGPAHRLTRGQRDHAGHRPVTNRPQSREASSMRRRSRPAQRGQVLVMFAGGLIALIAVVGLVIDGGNVFFNRRDDQNASDLASLAGTKRLYDYYVGNRNYTPTDNP